MSPDAFRRTLAGGISDGSIKFTNRGDVDIVSAIYERAFLSEMAKASELTYIGLAWGDEQVATLASITKERNHRGSARIQARQRTSLATNA